MVRPDFHDGESRQDRQATQASALHEQFLQDVGRRPDSKAERQPPHKAEKAHVSSVDESINGVPRYLDSMDPTKVETGLHKQKQKTSPAVPSDLAQVVPREELNKFKKAFELIGKYEAQCQKEVGQPTIKELAKSLDAAERAMPKQDLDKLERERILYGLALERKANLETPEGEDPALQNLVYHPDPVRGEAMRKFDEKALELIGKAAMSAAPRQSKVDSQYGPELEQAFNLQDRYNKLKEAREAPVTEI